MTKENFCDLGAFSIELKKDGFIINWQSFIKSKYLKDLQDRGIVYWSNEGIIGCSCKRLTFLEKDKELVKTAFLENGKRAKK